MNPPPLAANLDDPSALARLSDAIREWDPSFELYRPPTDALLYEPDGTLFAVALNSSMTAQYNRRRREVKPGDLMVVPSGLAVEVEPVVDLLGLRFEGHAPDHFRERFIQVWGYDLLASEDDGEIVSAVDLRFPFSYSIHRSGASTLSTPAQYGVGRTLLIVLDGRLHVAGSEPMELGPRDALLTAGGDALNVHGPGRLAVLHIEPEILFSARRAASRRAGVRAATEYLPPPPQSSGS